MTKVGVKRLKVFDLDFYDHGATTKILRDGFVDSPVNSAYSAIFPSSSAAIMPVSCDPVCGPVRCVVGPSFCCMAY